LVGDGDPIGELGFEFLFGVRDGDGDRRLVGFLSTALTSSRLALARKARALTFETVRSRKPPSPVRM
jgi:hypothetical protein